MKSVNGKTVASTARRGAGVLIGIAGGKFGSKALNNVLPASFPAREVIGAASLFALSIVMASTVKNDDVKNASIGLGAASLGQAVIGIKNLLGDKVPAPIANVVDNSLGNPALEPSFDQWDMPLSLVSETGGIPVQF